MFHPVMLVRQGRRSKEKYPYILVLLGEDCEMQIDISWLKAITGNTEDVPKIQFL